MLIERGELSVDPAVAEGPLDRLRLAYSRSRCIRFAELHQQTLGTRPVLIEPGLPGGEIVECENGKLFGH